MRLGNNQQAFFALLIAGLWEREVLLSQFEFIDFQVIYRLAEEQSVVGLVAAGLEHVSDIKVPKGDALLFASQALRIEQRNKELNEFVAQLMDNLRKQDVYAILVKGQGIAQCYERPLWRSSGDVDLLLSGVNYNLANNILEEIADKKENESVKNKERLHQAYMIDGWSVELHGTLHGNLTGKIDEEIDKVQDRVINSCHVRNCNIGTTQLYLPNADEDVLFVFTHILQHLFLEGVGLRQICDWCRLLWSFRSELNVPLLESRIKRMGLMSEWKAFAALAVEWLGMPSDAIPLYDNSTKWKRKAEKVISFVLETGNFGHNRVIEWSIPFKRRMRLFLHRINDTIKLSRVFPIDAPKFLLSYAHDCIKNYF